MEGHSRISLEAFRCQTEDLDWWRIWKSTVEFEATNCKNIKFKTTILGKITSTINQERGKEGGWVYIRVKTKTDWSRVLKVIVTIGIN